MAQDLRDFYLNHDDLVIGNEQLDQMAVGDLYGALKKKHQASELSKHGFKIAVFAAGVAFAFALAGPVKDFLENDPTKKEDNFGVNRAHITMAILALAATGLSAIAYARYEKNDAAARNLNDAYLMKIKPKDRAQAESESLYPDAFDGLVARGFIRKIEKFEYKN